MAVNPALRNTFTSLETGKVRRPRLCTRCGEGEPRPRGRLCGPCSADRYDERLAANRARIKAISAERRALRQDRDSISDLGNAARRAGLTVALIDTMDPPLTPEEERLLSHG